jgi:uncharacterized membrane protein (UPF0127 family)
MAVDSSLLEDSKDKPMSGEVRVTIGGKEWIVSLASDPWEQIRGLGGISEIDPGTGMLFDLGFPQIITVTTEPMLFPLDIAFFSDGMVVTKVYHNVQPGYLVTSTSPARYFLEVNAGELSGIDSGSQAGFELLASESPVQASDWVTPMISFMGFTLVGIFAISFAKAALKGPEQLRSAESSQSEADLLNPMRFPKRTEALDRLGVHDVVHVHDDGDLTVHSRGKLYVVTTEGEVFKQELSY